jgi:serine protease Do
LLAIPENSLDGLPLALSEDQLVLGERVRAFGYPLPEMQGYTLKVTDGTISGLLGFMDDPANFQCTAPIQPGNSGGPLLDDHGHLVGIAVASLNKISVAKVTGLIPENVNFGIHLDLVCQFLKQNHIELPTAQTQQPVDPER